MIVPANIACPCHMAMGNVPANINTRALKICQPPTLTGQYTTGAGQISPAAAPTTYSCAL
jgi:hypothetical protein